MKFGILVSYVRFEEKKIFEALQARNIKFDKIYDNEIILDYQRDNTSYDLILDRSISHTRSLQCLKIFNDWGIKTVNNWKVANICGDKSLTTSVLVSKGIPMPHTMIAYSPESALKAIEEMDYPVVLKPAIGSWGRLISKVNDREAAEGLVEHKKTLGTYHHSSFYIQKYIDKPGRDIRVLVIGDKIATAIYRKSSHWLTNASRGATAEAFTVTSEIEELSLKAAEAVGGGILAVDILEDKDKYLVIEINYTPEFKLLHETTGVDIAGMMVDYAMEVAKK